MSDRTHYVNAVTIASEVRSGERSPVDIIEAHLDRIDTRDDQLNAYVTVLSERAKERARMIKQQVSNGEDPGPLAGVPVAIKDLYGFVEGTRNTFGCKPLSETRADQNALFVDRIENAGGILLGKTNAPEFGHKATTDNMIVGPTSTPFDFERNAGGSSGGSAAAVAADLATVAQGSDGGGSIRIPASFCGIYGFKPSHRRIPNRERPDGFGAGTPYIHYGPLGRTVADTALLLDVMAGPHPSDPYSLPEPSPQYRDAVTQTIDDVSIAYNATFDGFPVVEEVRTVVDDAADAFSAAGADVIDASLDIPHTHNELCETWQAMHEDILAKTNESFKRTHDIDLLTDHRDELTPIVARQMEAGYKTKAISNFESSVVRTDVFDAIQGVLADYDLLITPTLAIPPTKNDTTIDGQAVGPSEINGERVDPYLGWCLTYPINFTGHPAASIPAGFTDNGLPVGLQIIGRRFDDETVLAASGAFERERPWHGEYPEW